MIDNFHKFALYDGLLALLYVMFYCVFVTFPCGVLGRMVGCGP